MRYAMKNPAASSLLIAVVLVVFAVIADAQQPKRVPRIGFVSGRNHPTPTTPDQNAEAFREGLRELGYTEGKNIAIEYRYAGNPGSSPNLVAELLQLNVDVLVIPLLSAIHAAKNASKTVPIIIITTEDPVAAGLVDSLARPGGNITGVTRLTRELFGKSLELLKQTVPGTSLVGVLWGESTRATNFEEYEHAARALKLTIRSLEVRSRSPDLTGAFQTARKNRVSALFTTRSAFLIDQRKQIADLAMKNRLPLMCEGSDYVEAGGLMSYATNDADSFRRAATYVDKILKGVTPADLPVEQPMKFEFVINLKTAKQIGLTIPPNVLARADKVIK
jgi:ABC-type uncharacterized transport system substrate-binding protein